VSYLPVSKRKSDLQAWLTGLCNRMEGSILSFNTSTAHVWGQMVAICDKVGIHLPTADSQLAATAHRHDLHMFHGTWLISRMPTSES